MGLLMGIDLGTTVAKAALFSRDGRLCGLGRVSLDKHELEGTCELPVDTFWTLLRCAVHDALTGAGARPDDVSALAYASQANSFALLDHRGACLTPLILWPDRRAESLGHETTDLWSRHDFLATTGVGVGGTGFCPYKLDWFRRREPSLWKRARYVQTISDYLVYGLTGERSGDTSTASMTGLWDQVNSRWWAEGLRQLGISPSAMSRPRPPGALVGDLTADGAQRLGLSAGIPVAAGALDHYAAALGAGLGLLADVCESTGTVLACIALTTRYEPRPQRCIGPTHIPRQYYNLAFNEAGTSNLDWYQSRFAPELAVPQLMRLAEDIPPGAMGLRAKTAFPGLAPEECFLNLDGRHSHGHRVRAIMEAAALALRDLVEDLGLDEKPDRILATGGGARSEVWLQIKADLLGMEVLQVDCEEPACQGAAMLAAAGAGQVVDIHELSRAFHRIKKRFQPDAGRHASYLSAFGLEPRQ
jgi:sugar (pentulose or hexulose) kinase